MVAFVHVGPETFPEMEHHLNLGKLRTIYGAEFPIPVYPGWR